MAARSPKRRRCWRGATGASYRRLDKALGPDLGQCCGGRVLLTIERFGAADRDASRAAGDGGARGRA